MIFWEQHKRVSRVTITESQLPGAGEVFECQTATDCNELHGRRWFCRSTSRNIFSHSVRISQPCFFVSPSSYDFHQLYVCILRSYSYELISLRCFFPSAYSREL